MLVALLLPIWKQRSKVWTDRTDLRKIGLKAGHFRPQFEHFEYYVLFEDVLEYSCHERKGEDHDRTDFREL